MFSIETNSGKLIRSHSYFQQEEEILLPPGIFLEVVDKFSSADGLNIIHLREIVPPYKMLADPFDLKKLKKALPESKPTSYAPSSTANEEKYSAPSFTSKPTSYTPSAVKIQEKYSSPSVQQTFYVQPSSEKSEFNIYSLI
jgi:hypothetical protein